MNKTHIEATLSVVAARLVQDAFAKFRERHPDGNIIEFVLVAAAPGEDPRNAVVASERVDLESSVQGVIPGETADGVERGTADDARLASEEAIEVDGVDLPLEEGVSDVEADPKDDERDEHDTLLTEDDKKTLQT